MIFFYCLFVCVCSGTLYSAVVLLVSIKLRFILGYSSVWYEAQRQDRVSVGRPIKNKQRHVAQKRTGFTKETQPQTNIYPENSIFGCYFWGYFFFYLMLIVKALTPLIPTENRGRIIGCFRKTNSLKCLKACYYCFNLY